MKNILLIGCGHMGSSLMNAWLNSKNYNLSIVDPIKYKSSKKKKYQKKIIFYENISSIKDFKNFDFIIFAVRPKDLDLALNDLSRKKFKKNTSVISVVAGKKINIFKLKLKSINQFVRVMPNMPALINQSMNCVVFGKYVTLKNKKLITDLFNLTGKTIVLKNENQIDMSTAISGSGPGYVYNLVDAMEQAAIKLGFRKSIAKILVNQTFKGSINLLIQSKKDPDKLVDTVKTKGGTTEAGLKIMDKNKVHDMFIKLAKASYNRAKQQGK